uniref:Band 7 domain-containing protein n=1 Tax=Panagrolaimus sp. JU765 TaxID=591449 RepID=A0AC34Q1R2_9BILA
MNQTDGNYPFFHLNPSFLNAVVIGTPVIALLFILLIGSYFIFFTPLGLTNVLGRRGSLMKLSKTMVQQVLDQNFVLRTHGEVDLTFEFFKPEEIVDKCRSRAMIRREMKMTENQRKLVAETLKVSSALENAPRKIDYSLLYRF